jgi:predicted metalloprotease with PDZ domain
MRFRLVRTAVAVASVLAVAAFAEDGKKCTASAEECARQIRQMLAGRLYLGVQLHELSPGLEIQAVVADSPAAHADLRPGDRLIAVNGHSTKEATIQDFKSILGDNGKQKRRLWMIVQRRGILHRIDVIMEPYSKAQIERVVAQHLAEAHSVASATPNPQP